MATPTQRYTDASASLVNYGSTWQRLASAKTWSLHQAQNIHLSSSTLVQSVVLYGYETWTMRRVDSDRIQSFHMQALCRILDIRWYDKVSNAVVSYCWQTSFIIWSHLSPTGERTCFAGTATVNRSPHRHSSRRWLKAPAGSSTKKLAATSGRRHWPICWCCPDRGPGSFDVDDATTLSSEII